MPIINPSNQILSKLVGVQYPFILNYSLQNIMRIKDPSSNRFKRTPKTISSEIIELIKNETIEEIIRLIDKTNRTLQNIQKISYYLEEVLQLSYFKLLKSHLTQIDYLMIIEKLTIEYREEKSIIIEKRKKNDSFYIVLWGQVIILDEIQTQRDKDKSKDRDRPNKDSKQFSIINKLQSGSTFGETSLVNPRRQATARVQASCPVVLLVLDYQIFSKTAMKITILKKQQIFNTFVNSPLFHNIDQNFINNLASQIYEMKLGLNEIIYAAGSNHDSLYFIKTGVVQLCQRNVKLVNLTNGQSFGFQFKSVEEQPRQQSAICRSNNVILYKVSFTRLKILQGDYQKLIKNLMLDCNLKRKLYVSLIKKSQKIQKLVATNSPSKLQKNRKDERKNERLYLKPEWWGVSKKIQINKPYDSLLSNISQKDVAKSPGILGIKRIHQLKYSVLKNKTQLKEEGQSQNIPILCSLKTTLSKKTRNKQNTAIVQEEQLKKNLPNLKKQKLVSYARSNTTSCQSIFVPYHLMPSLNGVTSR